MVHVGDIGVVFTATVKDGGAVVDVSGMSGASMVFNGPGSAVKTKTAAFTTDGTDGKVDYTTVSGDLDVPGRWTVQVVINYTGPTRTFHSDLYVFDVGPQSA